MKTYTKILMLLAMTLLVSACAASRKVTGKQTVTSTESEVTDHRVTTDQKSSTTEKSESAASRTEDIEEVSYVVVYDTSRPVDTVIGRPPVLSEQFLYLKVRTQTDQATNYNKETKDETLSVDSMKTERGATTQITAEVKEKKVSKVPIWLWLCLAAAVLWSGYVLQRYFRI